jgi:hypothetical protein
MSPVKTVSKRSRCSNGTRKNKRTGKCESVLDNRCAICLDRIISGNVKTKCKHNFHKKCLIGWCESQNTVVKPQCPICRADIKNTCKQIMPFDSKEVFRYVITYSTLREDYIFKQQKMSTIIHNKDFDVNVENKYGKSILSILIDNVRFGGGGYMIEIDYLLGNRNIEVPVELVQSLIANRQSKILQLFKQHKKIPKALKGLM